MADPGHMEFPGWGSDPSHSCNLCHRCSTTGSFNPLNLCPGVAERPPIPLHHRGSSAKIFKTTFWLAGQDKCMRRISTPSLFQAVSNISVFQMQCYGLDRERHIQTLSFFLNLFIFIFYFLWLFAISWAAPAAYGGSQARGQIGAAAAGLHQSHSNTGSEPHL